MMNFNFKFSHPLLQHKYLNFLLDKILVDDNAFRPSRFNSIKNSVTPNQPTYAVYSKKVIKQILTVEY